MKRIAIILITALLVGCAVETPVETPVEQREGAAKTVRINVAVPAAALPTDDTRAMSAADQAAVETLDVLVFTRPGGTGPYILAEHVAGRNANQATTNDYVISFLADLTASTAVAQVAVVANASAEVTAAVAACPVGSLKSDLLAQLRFSKTGEWGDDPIPMYGEVAVTTIANGVSIPSTASGSAANAKLSLRRMTAHIRVEMSTAAAARMRLDKVHLVSALDRGYISPKWDANGTLATFNAPNAVNVPASAAVQTGVQEFAFTTSPLTGEIFAFESPAVTDTDAARASGTHLVLEGALLSDPTKTYFWRVDFTTGVDAQGDQSWESDFNPEFVRFAPLMRNVSVNVTVDGVDPTGIGYATREEASASRTKISMLRTYIQAVSADGINNITYNGQYWLGSSLGSAAWPVTRVSYLTQSQQIQVATNYSGGWKLDTSVYPDGIEYKPYTSGGNPPQSGWLSAAYTGQNTTGGTIDITTEENSWAKRTAIIHLIAGSVRHTVAVEQAYHVPGVKAVYGMIGYIYNPGEPNHLQLTIEGDRDYYDNWNDPTLRGTGLFESHQDQYRVYVAYFNFGTLLALSSTQTPGEVFSTKNVIAWPTEWAATQTEMEAELAGGTTAAATYSLLPATWTAPATTTDPANGFGDACKYYDAQYFGGQGWKTPTTAEMGGVMLGGKTSATQAANPELIQWYARSGGSKWDPGRAVFPSWIGGTTALPATGNYIPGGTIALEGQYCQYWPSTGGSTSQVYFFIAQGGSVSTRTVSKNNNIGKALRCIIP